MLMTVNNSMECSARSAHLGSMHFIVNPTSVDRYISSTYTDRLKIIQAATKGFEAVWFSWWENKRKLRPSAPHASSRRGSGRPSVSPGSATVRPYRPSGRTLKNLVSLVEHGEVLVCRCPFETPDRDRPSWPWQDDWRVIQSAQDQEHEAKLTEKGRNCTKEAFD